MSYAGQLKLSKFIPDELVMEFWQQTVNIGFLLPRHIVGKSGKRVQREIVSKISNNCVLTPIACENICAIAWYNHALTELSLCQPINQ